MFPAGFSRLNNGLGGREKIIEKPKERKPFQA
jgi:hypothetical protein